MGPGLRRDDVTATNRRDGQISSVLQNPVKPLNEKYSALQ
jgi:hypothetical protein